MGWLCKGCKKHKIQWSFKIPCRFHSFDFHRARQHIKLCNEKKEMMMFWEMEAMWKMRNGSGTKNKLAIKLLLIPHSKKILLEQFMIELLLNFLWEKFLRKIYNFIEFLERGLEIEGEKRVLDWILWETVIGWWFLLF